MKMKYNVSNRKVAVIGAGFVGSSIAYALALKDIARDIVLIDIAAEKTAGEAMDIRHGIPSMGTANVYVGDYEDCADCDLIIITAGRNRREGETRLDLAKDNVKIVKNVTESIKKFYNRGVIMVVSNPLDVLVQKVTEWMNLPNGMVFGTGCVLDTSRLITAIADYVGISTGVINGYVVGEHGDSQVPLWSRVTIGGLPIDEYCGNMGIEWNDAIKADIAQRTVKMGSEIIKAKGRTHYGIATCVCYLADAIVNQRPTIASVSSSFTGKHGINGVALSIPSVVGPAGVDRRIHDNWPLDEMKAFLASAEKVRGILESVADE